MKNEDVNYRDAEVGMLGYLAYDEKQPSPRPGVVIVHDVWGLGGYMQERARRIAGLGYVALAADMYGERRVAATHPQALEFLGALSSDTDLVRRRAHAALSALAAHPQVDAKRLAAIGYCFGGMVVLEMARAGEELAGVVSFHGGLQTRAPAQRGGIKAKVLVCTGGQDPRVPVEQVLAFQNEMRQADADWQVVTYGGAQHAFTIPAADSWGRAGAAYDRRADVRSWIAMQMLLAEAFDVSAGQ